MNSTQSSPGAPASTSPSTHSTRPTRAPTKPNSPSKQKPPPTSSHIPAAGSLKPPVTRREASGTPCDTKQLRNDRLGALVRELCAAHEKASSWEAFVDSFRGPSHLSDDLDTCDHRAAALPRNWRDNGAPAETTSPPWTHEQKDRCTEQGCHPSATEHSTFLRQEMADFIENKFWMVSPCDVIRDLKQLMLSPAAVKPERERKPRLLCDHSWDWDWDSVKQATIPHAPPEAMQFGGALPRILREVRHANPKFGPVRASKQDCKDGFCRLFLQAWACLRLAVLLPRCGDKPQLVGIPMACTMGWAQSPPTFCTMSETVCDLANEAIRTSPSNAPPHRLESQASTHDDLSRSPDPRPREPDDQLADLALAAAAGVDLSASEPAAEPSCPSSNMAFNRPLASTDAFIDDFIQLAQGGPRRMKAIRRHLPHAVDRVLASPEVTNDKRLEAISLKKLLRGDGSWATRKVILGWIIDTLRQTIELPAHRKVTLAEIFSELKSTKRVSHKKWERILGKPRFVSAAMPGSTGLISVNPKAVRTWRNTCVREVALMSRTRCNAITPSARSRGSQSSCICQSVEFIIVSESCLSLFCV